MGKGLKMMSTLFLGALLFGCASKEEQAGYQTLKITPGYSVEEKQDTDAGRVIVATAKKAIGTPYVLGGTKPGGFDCSGFVMWAYNKVGVKLPRTAREQSTVGEKIKDQSKMRAGDIVAFHHPKRGYHTGIYIGDGKFIHSPRKRSSVKISSLDSNYFSSTLLGARRVKFDCDDSVLVAAASQLEDRKAGSGYVRIADEPIAPAPKGVKKSSRFSKKQTVKASRNGKKASIKAVAAKKASTKSSRTASLAKKPAKSSKAVVQASSRSRSTAAVTRSRTVQTAKITKKSTHKTVSMLQKRSR